MVRAWAGSLDVERPCWTALAAYRELKKQGHSELDTSAVVNCL